MVLVVPKAFILNSLLDSKLSDSLFTINSFIINILSINVKKYPKITKMQLLYFNFSSFSSGLTTVSWATLSISAMVGIVPSTFVG